MKVASMPSVLFLIIIYSYSYYNILMPYSSFQTI